jgi:hypothetical protein
MLKFSRLFSKLTSSLLAACVALLPFLVFAESSFAATTTDFVKSPGALDAALGVAMMIFSFIIIVIVLLAYLFALGIGELLDSTFILDSGMGDTLHLIWEVMRNFVNVAFILILLIIAVMVILKPGSEGGLGLLKKVLPKFILALVFVNLTFFAGRFILTTNDVLATAVFTLPKTVSGENMVKMPCNPNPVTPEGCRLEIMETAKEALTGNELDTGAASVANYKTVVEKLTKNLKSQKIADMVDKKNIALVLVTSMLDLEHLVYVKGLSGDGWDAAIGAVGSLIVAGAVGIIIFMLFLALIIRMVVLWLCIAISPLAALGIVLGDVIPGADMKGDFDLLDIFIKHAFMPTMVAVPLSIGLIMIFANNTAEFDSMGQIFSFSGGTSAGNFFSILWWIASIVIIWFGTSEMIKKASPKFAAMVTDKIHGGVNKFVGAAAGTLKYAPIIPTWNKDGTKGQGRSMGSFTEIPSRVQSLMSGQAGSRAGKSAESIAGHFGYTPKALDNATFNAEIKRAEIKDLPSLKAVLYELVRKKATSENSLDKTTASKLLRSDAGGALKTAGFTLSNLEGKSIREVLTKIQGKGGVESVTEVLDELGKNDKQFNATFVPSQEKAPEGLVKNTSGLTTLTAEQLKGVSDSNKTGLKTKDKKDIYKIEVEGKEVLFVPSDAAKPESGGTVKAGAEEFEEFVKLLEAKIKNSTDKKDVVELAASINALHDEYGEGVMNQLSIKSTPLAAEIEAQLKIYNITAIK